MVLYDLVQKNRSYRRFDQTRTLDRDNLVDLIKLARMTPSAANRQPLKYIIANKPELNQKIFSTLAWAGYLTEWDGPVEGERPTAYIIVLCDRTITENPNVDPGVVAQTIMLGAVEKGFGGCIIGSIKKEELSIILNLPEHLRIELVLALGHPVEKVHLDAVKQDGSIKYFRDEDDVHHVPKRALEEILLELP